MSTDLRITSWNDKNESESQKDMKPLKNLEEGKAERLLSLGVIAIYQSQCFNAAKAFFISREKEYAGCVCGDGL